MFPPQSDPFFDQYGEVLQNIESAVIRFYREHPALLDHNVHKVYEALERQYKAEMNGRNPPALRLTPLEQALYDKISVVCQRWTGRSQSNDPALAKLEITPVEVSVIIQCFKRLLKSIKLWTNEYGIRGYLDYVKNFIAQAP